MQPLWLYIYIIQRNSATHINKYEYMITLGYSVITLKPYTWYFLEALYLPGWNKLIDRDNTIPFPCLSVQSRKKSPNKISKLKNNTFEKVGQSSSILWHYKSLRNSISLVCIVPWEFAIHALFLNFLLKIITSSTN